mmetsp:Transcript_37452/g.95041  ORF Transcript_37452/g.95041 Transcript_37452/m.95041 type:complete len:235 (-) Transcript_37452:660-1364(-)
MRGGEGRERSGHEYLAYALVGIDGRARRGRGEAEDVEREAGVRAEDDRLEDVDAGLGEGAGDGGERAGLVLKEQVEAQGLLARTVGVVLPVASHARVRVVAQVLEELQVDEAVLEHGADHVVRGEQRDELVHLLEDQGARRGELLLRRHRRLQRRRGWLHLAHGAAHRRRARMGRRDHAQRRRGGAAGRRAVHRSRDPSSRDASSRDPAQVLRLLRRRRLLRLRLRLLLLLLLL